jgi:hypothetical protein
VWATERALLRLDRRGRAVPALVALARTAERLGPSVSSPLYRLTLDYAYRAGARDGGERGP